jgi:hypothetical protein
MIGLQEFEFLHYRLEEAQLKQLYGPAIYKTSLIVFDSAISKPKTECIPTHLIIYNHPSAALVRSHDSAFPIVFYLSRFTSI